ncbi:MAG: sigma-54-dependent Fis family transcriptional regulator [Acidobacteriaceae bacterium]|nr:sigma-54-dependent Fis family transcriptional regulator [Acidobacteriaceae bacterium]
MHPSIEPSPIALPLPGGEMARTSRGQEAIVGESAAMQRLRLQVRRLGPHFRILLLHGEAGTGKELVARTLHDLSSHASGPFVQLRCGHNGWWREKDLRSYLRAAHRGTLYFDQVGRLGVGHQAELLSVLRGRERGQDGPILVRGLEARIIASTAEDLRIAVATGGFLQELHRRIAAVEIPLPPLRERVEDIPGLVRYFIERHSADSALKPSVPSSVYKAAYRWPGNVEELENMVRRGTGDGFGEQPTEEPDTDVTTVQAAPARLQEVVEQHVLQVLKECGGNKVRAAEVLGISRSTLYRMLEAGLSVDKLPGLREELPHGA